MTSTLQLHAVSFPPSISVLKSTQLGFSCGYHLSLDCTKKGVCRKHAVKALSDSTSSENGKGEVVVSVVRDKVSDLKLQVARLQQRVVTIANAKRYDGTDLKNQVARLQQTVASLPPVLFLLFNYGRKQDPMALIDWSEIFLRSVWGIAGVNSSTEFMY